MTTRQGGMRRKTRHKLSKPIRDKGKLSQRRFFQNLEVGEKVTLAAEPAYQKGMYYPRFHGKVGIVKGKSGQCYNVAIKDHDREKVLIVHPIHLKKRS